jgi:protein-S-isoprenylcysteine O-methyltransferase Ste14
MQSSGWAWVAGQVALFAVYALALTLAPPAALPAPWAPGVTSFGFVLLLIAVTLGASAALKLGPALTPSPLPTTKNRLVTDGPFRWLRHPIYGAVLIGLAGWALVRHHGWALACVVPLAVFLWRKAGFEERHLLDRHPDYRRYQRRTPWRILPFL